MTQSIKTPTIHRRRSVAVQVGDITIGGGAPIVVQSMTSTDSSDVAATTAEIIELAEAGSEIVRITVNNEAAARAIPEITEKLATAGIRVPLVGDFHYNGHKLVNKYPQCVAHLDKLRINPGNVGRGSKHDSQFAQLIEYACLYQKPVRIGVNWGSLDQDLLKDSLDDNAKSANPLSLDEMTYRTMIESALQSAARAEDLGLPHNAIVLSCKLSDLQGLVCVYRALAEQCDYPLHLGLTEAGMGRRGTVCSSAALAILLQEGIGDTIRVSLTPQPGGSRSEEVRIAQDILQALKIRSFIPAVVACPGCGRTSSDYFQKLAAEIEDYIQQRMPDWKTQHPGVENMTVAVMGCVVNGPGESKHADIGISLPGSGERPVAPVYINGKHELTLHGDSLVADFKALVEKYVKEYVPPKVV
ncbi:MAG: flavodoxin-dependent (E)-4-hydroxy-3-methylbut-2-enyl-diphosphate synthase [Gammaproteobacteria bacterium]|nr:flavodoxin-dependent (E)-4-hydroxy-3-methylbut-2-enyl-diphosphate synthase [Gammaproteobacteria bacterium]